MIASGSGTPEDIHYEPRDTKVHFPEDDAFDHNQLRDQSHNSNLVRGASTRTKAQSLYSERPLTYIDEDFNYHSNKPRSPQDDPETPLVYEAADMGRSKNFQDLGKISNRLLGIACPD